MKTRETNTKWRLEKQVKNETRGTNTKWKLEEQIQKED